MKEYYVVFTAPNMIIGSTIVKAEHIDTADDVKQLQDVIKKENNFENVVILNWKELKEQQ